MGARAIAPYSGLFVGATAPTAVTPAKRHASNSLTILWETGGRRQKVINTPQTEYLFIFIE